jgi:cytochrome c553
MHASLPRHTQYKHGDEMTIAPTRRARVRQSMLCLFAALASGQALAETKAAQHERLENAARGVDPHAAEAAGHRAAFFCANCHGETGMSKYSEVPNLASQHPAYLHKQIEAFQSGERKDAFMQGLVKILSADDKNNIVAYYSAQPVTPVAAAGPRAAEGQGLFAKHCVRCHGNEARGGETFPRLAGQQAEYLRRNLKRYLTMSGERIFPPMTAAVTGLGEKNIEAVVDYLSSLK